MWQTCSFLSVLRPPALSAEHETCIYGRQRTLNMYLIQWLACYHFLPQTSECARYESLLEMSDTRLRFLLSLLVVIWAWPQVSAGSALHVDTYNKKKTRSSAIWILIEVSQQEPKSDVKDQQRHFSCHSVANYFTHASPTDRIRL